MGSSEIHGGNSMNRRVPGHKLGLPIALSCAGLLALVLAAPARSSPPSHLYRLAWEDTFNRPSLDTSKWNYRTDVKALSSQLASNVVIDHNQLSLLMKQQSVAGKQFTGGGIVSKRKFGYGYFEVRAKTTTNRGWHNSFWMMAGDGSDTYGAGRFLEIDQSEINTQNPLQIPSGLQIWNGRAGRGSNLGGPRCQTYAPGFSTADSYHTYGVDWSEGRIDFYLDGVNYCTISYPADKFRQDPVNIWLTALAFATPVSVGGSSQYYDDVRFYKKDQYVINGNSGYSESGSGWKDSSLVGFGLMPQRYSCTSGDTSTYAPRFLQGGSYHVYIWKTVASNADTAADVRVLSPARHRAFTFDFTKGQSGWVDLGIYTFKADRTKQVNGVVNIVRSGCQRAGAVKFIRVS